MDAPTDVEFRTLDGTILRGHHYKISGDGARPVAVIAPPLTMLKESQVAELARGLQAGGINVLLFDHRGFGASEGHPRYDVDPFQSAEDYIDAVTAAHALPNTDPDKIVLVGMGHSTGWAAIAASRDPRPAALVMYGPFFSGAQQQQFYPPHLLSRAWGERAAVVRDTDSATSEPEYIQAWPDSPEEAALSVDDPQAAWMVVNEGLYGFIADARAMTDEAGVPWVNRVTLRSAYNLARTECENDFNKITIPAFYVGPTQDPTMTMEQHRKAFELLPNGTYQVWPDVEADSVRDVFRAHGEFLAEWIKTSTD